MKPIAACIIAGLAAMGLAGCLDAADYDQIHDEATERALRALEPATEGLPHGDHFNLEPIAFHNGFDETGEPGVHPVGGRYTEFAITDDYAFLGRSSQGTGLTGGEGGYGGFVVLDIRDPTAPFLMGEYPGPGTSDIEVADTGDIVFLGTQRSSIEEVLGGVTVQQAPETLGVRGIHVVDISNIREPTLDHFVPLPYNGIHTIEFVRHPVNDRAYVIAATYDLPSNTIPSTTLGPVNALFPSDVNPITQRVVVFELTDSQLPTQKWQLVPVSTFQLQDLAPPGSALRYFPHDTFVEQHPITGQVLLYVSYWDKGLQIVDFDEPGSFPQLTQLEAIGSIESLPPSDYIGLHLSIPMPDLVPFADGSMRHITVTEPEVPSGDHTGQISFVDTSDPTAPVLLGHWTQPFDELVTVGFDHSPHNFDILDGQVAMSHQQLGVWIIDASIGAHVESPKTVGYWIPEGDGGGRGHGVWGAFWQEHPGLGKLVYAVDTPTGLHVLRYTGP